jgi:hypothetical protein
MIKSFHRIIGYLPCVSKKIYNDLESKYTDLKKKRIEADDNSALVKAKTN